MAMLAFTLAACTTTPKPIEGIGPDAFSRIGRFAITVNEESGKQNAVQGGFSWSDDGRRYVLDLTNPLGSTEARVEGQPGSASLTKADGTRLMADNPDALAEDALGSSMPVAGLRDWLRGKLPAEPSRASCRAMNWAVRPASSRAAGACVCRATTRRGRCCW